MIANVALHIVAIASLAALGWTLREHLLAAVALIHAAGGYDAWKKLHGRVAPH